MALAEIDEKILFATFAGAIDRQSRTLRDVSIITGNVEAEGHGVFVDSKSLASAMRLLMGRALPAYLTHEDAITGDRLSNEIGLWSGFYLDGNTLRARQFKFFPSFAKAEEELMDRLFDLAEAMPGEFGVSLVHGYKLVWVFTDGTELPAKRGERPPEGTIRPIPSVRFTEIESADFTKEPAANPAGLFSSLFIDAKDKVNMSTQLQSDLDAIKAEFSTFKTNAEKAATEADQLKAAFAKDREAFAKQMSDLTAERDAAKKALEDEKASFAKQTGEAKAAFEVQVANLTGKLAQAERMSAFKLGVPPPEFVLDEKTVVTSENGWVAYNSITDPEERSAFYRKHRDILTSKAKK